MFHKVWHDIFIFKLHKNGAYGNLESAKSRAWRACVLDVLAPLRAYLLGVLVCLCAYLLGELVCLCAYLFGVLVCLSAWRAYVLCVLGLLV